MVGGLISFVLTMIPVIGAPIGAAANAAADIANVLDHGSEIGKDLLVHILDVDLSAFKGVGALHSKKPFERTLDGAAYVRFKSVFEHSAFITFEEFLTQISNFESEAAGRSANDSNDTMDETHLMHSFRVIASKADRNSVSAQDAATELSSLLKKTDPKLQVDEDHALETVLQQADEGGRVSMTGFSSAFAALQTKYQPRRVRQPVAELRTLFQNAAEPNGTLKVAVAKHILKRFYEGRQTDDDWDENRIEQLLQKGATEDMFIDEERFILVANEMFQ